MAALDIYLVMILYLSHNVYFSHEIAIIVKLALMSETWHTVYIAVIELFSIWNVKSEVHQIKGDKLWK